MALVPIESFVDGQIDNGNDVALHLKASTIDPSNFIDILYGKIPIAEMDRRTGLVWLLPINEEGKMYLGEREIELVPDEDSGNTIFRVIITGERI